MKLEYDTDRLAALSEQELKALHKELIQLEKDAHKARALVWRELTLRRSVRISDQTREKGRQARHRSKIRELEKDLQRKSARESPAIRRLIELSLASKKISEAIRIKRRGRTITTEGSTL